MGSCCSCLSSLNGSSQKIEYSFERDYPVFMKTYHQTDGVYVPLRTNAPYFYEESYLPINYEHLSGYYK